MAAGIFKISEIPPGKNAGDGEVFMWTADRQKSDGWTGIGAYAAPQGVWELGGDLDAVKTKYPGGISPSVQVMGPTQAPQQFRGMWSDRYNGAGWAVAEMDRFEKMCRRGNLVQVEFQEQCFVGIIKPWRFPYKRKQEIGYEFTLDTFNRAEDDTADKTPPTVDSPDQAVEDLQLILGKTAATHADKPAHAIGGTNGASLIGKVSNALAKTASYVNDLAAKLDIKTGVLKPIGDFRAMSTQLRRIQGSCAEVITQLGVASAATSMGVRTAVDVLSFETWKRSTARLMRLASARAVKSAKDLDRKFVHKAGGVYRPRKGESVYAVSRTVYGTPHEWRAIMAANPTVRTIRFNGTETLTIPERGGA